jgi:predicted nucleotidyltransferase component of viral defense system
MNNEPAVERESFLQLPEDDRRDILQNMSTEIGLSAAVLEKDVWVCWALKTLFEISQPQPMAFKGGTSLSKVYNAIERFSEDIDVTIDYKSLLPEAEPFKENISRTQLKKLTEQLRELVSQHTHKIILPAFRAALDEQFGEGLYKLELSENGENLSIQYKPIFRSGYITEQVLVEFGGRNAITPSASIPVKPYIAKRLLALEFPDANVIVLAPERTFWEKVTLIHAECNAKKLDKLERKCRHWYDVFKLSKTAIGHDALANRDLLDDVVRHKLAFFFSGTAYYEACCNAMRLVPDDEMLKALEQDYREMIRDGMFYAEPPAFNVLIADLKETRIAHQCTGNSNSRIVSLVRRIVRISFGVAAIQSMLVGGGQRPIILQSLRQIGIGDEESAEAKKIGEIRREELLRNGFAQAAGNNHGPTKGLTDFSEEILRHGGFRIKLTSTYNVEVDAPPFLKFRRQIQEGFFGLGVGIHPIETAVGRDTHSNAVRTEHAGDYAEGFEQEPRPALLCLVTVFIAALVNRRVQKLVKKVSIRAVDFRSVKAGFFCVVSAAFEVAKNPLKILFAGDSRLADRKVRRFALLIQGK